MTQDTTTASPPVVMTRESLQKNKKRVLQELLWVMGAVVGARASKPANSVNSGSMYPSRGLGGPRSYDYPHEIL